MKKIQYFLGILLIMLMVFQAPLAVLAEEDLEEVTEITEAEAGVSATEAATVTAEPKQVITERGMLIEIGNTTADETTIIIRVNRDGVDVDQTVQINENTKIRTNEYRSADLSDWIAGDQISYTAEEGENSGELVALVLRNLSFKAKHHGRNGWIKDIRSDVNEMDVEWAGQIYTLNVANARMVAGLKNPATLDDFQVGDRIRARVVEDGDGNNLTWDAEIVVVLRRGKDLFMRVTRWVVPAEITSIPEDTSTLPLTITAEVLPSKFYEEGDVNNLIGAPGTTITIQIDEDTKLVRRYLGRAKIGEFSEGDRIRVIGRLNEETGYIDAEVIKNNSIQKLGVAQRLSEVISVDTSNNTIVVVPIAKQNPITKQRKRIRNGAQWTIQVSSETKITKHGEDLILSDVVPGDIIRVRGTANRIQHVVDAHLISVVTDRFQDKISD